MQKTNKNKKFYLFLIFVSIFFIFLIPKSIALTQCYNHCVNTLGYEKGWCVENPLPGDCAHVPDVGGLCGQAPPSWKCCCNPGAGVQEISCVKINGTNYCCGEEDDVCPEDFEDPQGISLDCQAIGKPDIDCEEFPPTECEIVSAGVTKQCGADNICDNGEKIKLAVKVIDRTKCKSPNEIEIDAFTASQPNGCWKVTMNATALETIPINGGATYQGDWVVEIPPGCEGQFMTAKKARLFNVSGLMDDYQKPAGFGTFMFGGAIPTECKIIDANVKTYCGAEGCDDGDKIELNITVEDPDKCKNVNQIEIDARDAYAPPNGMCSVKMNVTILPQQKLLKSYIENWTVDVPVYCEGRTVAADFAKVFNETGIIANKRGDFGTFKFFEEEAPPECECSCIGSPGYNTCGYCCNATHQCVDVGGQGQLVACPPDNPDCVNGNVCVGDGSVYCHDLSESPCIAAHPSCYWDWPDRLTGNIYCKHCTYDDPGSCSGYDNKTECINDPCGEKYTGCPSGKTCNCEWNGTDCYLKIQDGVPGSGEVCCEYSVSFGQCDGCDGQTNSRRRVTTCDGPCQDGDQCNMTTYEHCALTGYTETMEDCQACAILFRPLPFFSWFNILAVVTLLVVFYLFMLRKKKFS